MSELTAAEKAVFGVDAYKDEAGKIVEQGFGAVKNKSAKIMDLEKDAEAVARVNLTKLEERARLEAESAEKAGKSLLGKAEDVFKGLANAVTGEVKKIEEDF